jgi:serine/threonine protein kinase
MYNNKVDIWAMGCILYELATGMRPFQSDWEVLGHRFSGKNVNVVLNDSFDTHSVETITKHIVDMLQVDPTHRPSASILSNEFNRQLELAQHSVLLRATESVTLEAKYENRNDGEDELVLESQNKSPLDLAEESPAKVSSTKVFR